VEEYAYSNVMKKEFFGSILEGPFIEKVYPKVKSQ
jgi:hypothetical protein